MAKKQLTLVFVTTLDTLSAQGEADIKAAVQRFREDVEYLGAVVRADLVDVEGQKE